MGIIRELFKDLEKKNRSEYPKSVLFFHRSDWDRIKKRYGKK